MENSGPISRRFAQAALLGAAFGDATDINAPGGGNLHVYSPNGRAELMRRAREFGQKAARNPQWAVTKLRNEQFYVNNGEFCPDAWADADFRAWLRKRYADDLSRLNAAWGTSLASWDDAAQPISAVAGSGQEGNAGAIEKTLGTNEEMIDILGAGEGRLCGTDFDNATLLDVLTGKPAGRSFSLPAFGYRIFELSSSADPTNHD